MKGNREKDANVPVMPRGVEHKGDWDNDREIEQQLIAAGLLFKQMREQEAENRIEEIPCDSCACPLYIGGTGEWELSGTKVYCSKKCATFGARNNAPIHKRQTQGVYVDNWLV